MPPAQGPLETDLLVLTRRQIPDKGSEISWLSKLAAELHGHGVALDAPHDARDRADHLVTDEHAGHLVTIEATCPGCWLPRSER